MDVLFGNDRWLKEALKNPNFDAAGYPVIALPFLVLMKLTAQRAQDWADVSRMLGWASDADLDAVRAGFDQSSAARASIRMANAKECNLVSSSRATTQSSAHYTPRNATRVGKM